MRILVTGASGMLGRTLLRRLSPHCEVIACRRTDADITDAAAVRRFIVGSRPDAVIHCAAATAVDRCESEREKAFAVNEGGTRNVALASRDAGARLIAISTDYVFRGNLDRPYREDDEADGGDTVYGQTKFVGEKAALEACPDAVVARVSWLYGPGGPSFVHTMMRLADGTRPFLKVVNDQVGNPTSTDAVAGGIEAILGRPDIRGVVHLTCEGEASWFYFARKIFELAGVAQEVLPCMSAEYPRPAKPPANSRLEKRAIRLAGLPAMPRWEDALRDFMRSEFGRG